ncbi:hypothetical protein AABB24_027132 [Solanum stoloniferum]|uniref:Uncharacterized protein n=1 Tax=Solanum stoloniferum TaxID=62892 RepID=A0ABD2SHV2_9SOLN
MEDGGHTEYRQTVEMIKQIPYFIPCFNFLILCAFCKNQNRTPKTERKRETNSILMTAMNYRTISPAIFICFPPFSPSKHQNPLTIFIFFFLFYLQNHFFFAFQESFFFGNLGC